MKKKWTFIDTLIVIIVIAVVGLAAFKVLPSKLGKSENKKVEFTVMIQNSDQELADAIRPGARLRSALPRRTAE